MPRLSGFFDPRAGRAAEGVPPRLQFHDASGSYSYVISERSEVVGQFVKRQTPVPFGTALVLDFGAAEKGPLSFNPFDDGHLVPLHHPNPEPLDGYTMVVRAQVLIQGFGLAQWTIGGVIAQNAVYALFNTFQNAGEAVAGKLPVYRLRSSRQIQIASRNNEVHTCPVLELIGWIDRDEGRFGPRTVPAPIPLLERTAADARIFIESHQAANSNRPEAPWEEAASKVATSPAANDDLFQGLVPVGKEQRPKF